MHAIVAPFMDEMVKKHKCIGEARCIGLFGALEVVKNKETREPMQEYGVPGPVMPWIFAELKKRGFATFGRENFIEICRRSSSPRRSWSTICPSSMRC